MLYQLEAKPLTSQAFAAFGEVIELAHAQQLSINDGLTTRFHDLCQIDVIGAGARAGVSVFRTTPVALPHRVQRMERHPLGSQAFFPLQSTPFLILVAPPGERVRAQDLQLFVSNGLQAVNFFRNTWHHYQLALAPSDFLVIDRVDGQGENLQELELEGEAQVLAPS